MKTNKLTKTTKTTSINNINFQNNINKKIINKMQIKIDNINNLIKNQIEVPDNDYNLLTLNVVPFDHQLETKENLKLSFNVKKRNINKSKSTLYDTYYYDLTNIKFIYNDFFKLINYICVNYNLKDQAKENYLEEDELLKNFYQNIIEILLYGRLILYLNLDQNSNNIDIDNFIQKDYINLMLASQHSISKLLDMLNKDEFSFFKRVPSKDTISKYDDNKKELAYSYQYPKENTVLFFISTLSNMEDIDLNNEQINNIKILNQKIVQEYSFYYPKRVKIDESKSIPEIAVFKYYILQLFIYSYLTYLIISILEAGSFNNFIIFDPILTILTICLSLYLITKKLISSKKPKLSGNSPNSMQGLPFLSTGLLLIFSGLIFYSLPNPINEVYLEDLTYSNGYIYTLINLNDEQLTLKTKYNDNISKYIKEDNIYELKDKYKYFYEPHYIKSMDLADKLMYMDINNQNEQVFPTQDILNMSDLSNQEKIYNDNIDKEVL